MYPVTFLIITYYHPSPWAQSAPVAATFGITGKCRDVRPTLRHHYVMLMVGEGHYLTLGKKTPCTLFRARRAGWVIDKNTRKTTIF